MPVFCFGLAALAAPRLIRRFSMGPLLGLTMVAVICGCALRLAPSLFMLFAGTVVLGIGIAVGNVLLPGLIKRDFPQQRVLMTALYSVALCRWRRDRGGPHRPDRARDRDRLARRDHAMGRVRGARAILLDPARAGRAGTRGGHDPGHRCAASGATRWPGA